MRLEYDRTADALYVSVRVGRVARTKPREGCIVDYDAAGHPLGYEFLGVRSGGIVINDVPPEVVDYIAKRLPWVRFGVDVVGTLSEEPKRRAASPPPPSARKSKSRELVG